MNIHCIRHVPFEGPGSIGDWAKHKGYRLSTTRLYGGESLPDIDPIDWMIIMGGPMGIYDENKYPWLREEKAFIKNAVDKGKVVIGICLGAQLIADALGAKIYKNRYREIGWFPIKFTRERQASKLCKMFPEEILAFHWHSDTFDLPSEATLLASSEACENQAFGWEDRVFGFQFHLEITAMGAAALIEHCGHEIVKGKYIQSADEILSEKSSFHEINRLMDKFLENLAAAER